MSQISCSTSRVRLTLSPALRAMMGTKAGFEIEDSQMRIFTEDRGELLDAVPSGKQADDGHARNLRNFVDVVLDGAEPCYKPQQGVDMIAILEGFYKSAAEGREVRLDE